MTDRHYFDDLGPDSERETGRRDRRLLRWLMLAIVVVIGGIYLAGYAFASDRLPQSTTVAGVDVGGMRPERAVRELREALADERDRPVELRIGSRTFALAPEDVGLDVDVPASVAQVPVGRSWSVADMWETVAGGEDYEAVVVRIDDLLPDRVQEIADEVGRPPVEGAVTFTRNGPDATYPERGTTFDVPATVELVADAYPSATDPVRIELTAAEPEVTSAEVSRAMQEFANPAMSAPVTFTVKGEPVVLRPPTFARALSMEAKAGRLEPQADERVLQRVLDPALGRLGRAPRDATVRIVDGGPQIVPARNGVSVDPDQLGKTFLDLVADRDGQREAPLPTTVAEPDRGTQEVRALGITERVSEFTTFYPHADYRNINIGRAAQLIDGTILEPGETFSLNDTVGERTRENGFTEGFVISDGILKEDLGGGVSQMATTTFNAAFFAGLEDVEHKPHSFYIDRYPVGREATVAWPTVDLRFRNDTDHGILIETSHSPSSFTSQGSITVRMWSTKVWDITSRTSDRYAYTSAETRYLTGDECVPNVGFSGFQVDVTRVFRRAGQSRIHHTERLHTTYIPSDSVVCR